MSDESSQENKEKNSHTVDNYVFRNLCRDMVHSLSLSLKIQTGCF